LPPRLSILVERRTRAVPLPAADLRRAARLVLAAQNIREADISVAIVSDPEIHRVNREHLAHDFPTDVISFLYDVEVLPKTDGAEACTKPPRRIEGEVVISAETAARQGPTHGWSPQSELLLYLVHGLLHLCGFDDLSPGVKRIMRREEQAMLRLLDIDPPARQAKSSRRRRTQS
jgi:probable rRNA maturation factor